MANIDMPVVSASVILDAAAGAPSSLMLAPKDSAGSGIDLTGAAVAAYMSPSGNPVAGAATIALSISLLVASAGKLVIALAPPAACNAGLYTAELFVTPPGGTMQLLARISVTAI